MKIKNYLIGFLAISFCIYASAQKTNAEYAEELKIAGYPVVNTFSFLVTKKNFALTSLSKSSTEKGPLFTAEISPEKDGAHLFFRAYRTCIPTDPTKPHETIIMISGQKIGGFYACASNGRDPQTFEMFLIKSTEGKQFATKEFSESDYVVVHLHNLPVPFHTQGFLKVLSESSGKAL